MSAKINLALACKFIFVISLALAAGCVGPAEKTANQPDQPHFTEIEVKGVYTHKPTSMEFPTQLAGFKRGKILEYDSSGKNISVEYTLSSLGFKIADATVYIYPVKTGPESKPVSLEKHYDELRALLFNIYTDARDLEDKQITIDQPTGQKNGLMFRFVHQPPELFNSLCYAKLYLFQYGPWFIKYRLTNPVKNDIEVDLAFKDFMNRLTWPTPAQDSNQTD